MTMGNICKISVGEQLPGYEYTQDGAKLHLDERGRFILFVNLKNQTDAEHAALVAGFSSYSYYEASGDITLASWVFKFPAPVGYLDAPFHAGLYPDNRATLCLEEEWNAMHSYFLDGDVVRVIRTSGLNHEAVTMFRKTVQRQLAENASMTSYNRAVDNLFRFAPKEIYKRGTIFQHGAKKLHLDSGIFI